MGYFRLFRRVRLTPGISLNLSAHGPSVSLGARGAHVTIGRSGVRRTVGLPGTGIYYTSRQGWHSGIHTAQPFHDAAPPLEGLDRVVHDMFLILFALFLLGLLVGFYFLMTAK